MLIGYWVIAAGFQIEKDPELSQSSKLFKRLLKIIALVYIYQLAKFGNFYSLTWSKISDTIVGIENIGKILF